MKKRQIYRSDSNIWLASRHPRRAPVEYLSSSQLNLTSKGTSSSKKAAVNLPRRKEPGYLRQPKTRTQSVTLRGEPSQQQIEHPETDGSVLTGDGYIGNAEDSSSDGEDWLLHDHENRIPLDTRRKNTQINDWYFKDPLKQLVTTDIDSAVKSVDVSLLAGGEVMFTDDRASPDKTKIKKLLAAPKPAERTQPEGAGNASTFVGEVEEYKITFVNMRRDQKAKNESLTAYNEAARRFDTTMQKIMKNDFYNISTIRELSHVVDDAMHEAKNLFSSLSSAKTKTPFHEFYKLRLEGLVPLAKPVLKERFVRKLEIDSEALRQAQRKIQEQDGTAEQISRKYKDLKRLLLSLEQDGVMV